MCHAMQRRDICTAVLLLVQLLHNLPVQLLRNAAATAVYSWCWAGCTAFAGTAAYRVGSTQCIAAAVCLHWLYCQKRGTVVPWTA